ncbi:MAG: phage adaptor protein [Candidatus Thorarchaeota archaeon]|jgi:hypothetical protein
METVNDVQSYIEFQIERVVDRLDTNLLAIINLGKDRICAWQDWWFLDTERTIATVDGDDDYDPPSRFLGLGKRAWWVDDNDEKKEIVITNRSEARLQYSTTEEGEPKYLYYDYENEDLIFAPIPDDAYTVHYDAMIKLADLALGQSNLLTIHYPHILIAASMAEAWLSIDDIDRYNKWNGEILPQRMMDLIKADNRFKSSRAQRTMQVRTGAKGTSLASTHRDRRF